MGTTGAPYNLRFPDGTDPANVPQDMSELAVDVAAALTGIATNVTDTGWVNLAHTSGTGQCQYRCRNGVVTVRLSLSGITAITPNTSRQIVNANTIPVAYRPTVSVYQAGSSGGSGMSLGVCGTDGGIAIWNPSYNSGNCTVARLTFTYLKEGI